MGIKFITGNKDKFKEVQEMLSPVQVEQVDLYLPEIQSLDAHEIIRYKLQEALKHEQGEFIVEDTSLYFEALDNKLPGPFIKWFLHTLGPAGLAELVLKIGKQKAYDRTILGYAKHGNDIHFFEGVNEGTIVSPRGDKDFGWGPIFLPNGSDLTYGEMEREQKYKTSMRGMACKKLKEFLEKSN